ncbi:MAG: recombinase family protein [Oscillospiraceae bacterium]|nr:recombinase family protein [Oscillospiraceae bacterium]
MINQQQKLGAIYLRLSRDDGGDSESNSITNQREMLLRYASDKGIIVINEYIDDGVSGTTFDRCGFNRMVSDIECGKIGTVICKDLSRLGRNNALVAYYTEIFFVEKRVRFICVNDGIDSAQGDNDIMPFKSIINEYYAKDISKKIRSVKTLHAHKGRRAGGKTPFGYILNPDDKHYLIPDTRIAPVIKEMFSMAANGKTVGDIRKYLVANNIPTPSTYRGDKAENCDWNKTSITKILKNCVYIGHTVAQKHATVSFKSKKRIIRPESDWVEVKNTHEAITDEQTFNKVQKLIGVKQRANKSDFDNIFKGLLRCETCGASMSLRNSNRPPHYLCNTSRNQHETSVRKCTTHHVRFAALNEVVLRKVKKLAALAKVHESDLTEFLRTIRDSHSESDVKREQQELERLNTRITELDAIIKKLLEQNALGVISNERFVPLVTEYDSEQKALLARVGEIQSKLKRNLANTGEAADFFGLLTKYTDIQELTMPLLHELIDKIVVHERVVQRIEGKEAVEQEIDVHFKFLGLTPESI